MVIIIQGSFGLVVSDDPTFNIGFVTSAIETNLAIITASAPALRPLLRAKDRGGWLPSLGRRTNPDVEMAEATLYSATSAGSRVRGARGGSGKLSQGGSRGGRKGGRKDRGGRKAAAPRGGSTKNARELRSRSPRRSEEEIMTNNGVMRISDIQREIDGIVQDMSLGPGSYGSSEQPRGAAASSTRRYRYYSESVYPDEEYRAERDFNEERISRYGDKRFGRVTPKSASSKWADNGRPF